MLTTSNHSHGFHLDLVPGSALVNSNTFITLTVLTVFIGERFAMTEMKIAMVKLLQNFTLETDVNSEIKLLNGDMFMYGYPDFGLKFIRRDFNNII